MINGEVVDGSAAGTPGSRVLNEQELYVLPVHGQHGRIAAVRRELGMTQGEFAAACNTSRETVSHWENVYPDDDPEGRAGEPRQRTTRASSKAIAELVRKELGLAVRDDAFYGWGDHPLDAMRIEQQQMAEQIEQILALLGEIKRKLR
jgi:DNA-binding XRE family transcriptional regulator